MRKPTEAVAPKTGRPGRPTTRRPEEAANSTVIVGIKLLQIVAGSSEPETLTQIAKRANLTVSRTHRYLKSLTQSNFLKWDPDTGKYTIGMAAVELGLAAVAKIDALHLAGDVMRDLTSRTGLVSTLSVWGTNGPTIIKSEDTHFDVSVRVREGLNLSLPITAVGRVFLTYAPPEQVDAPLKRDLATWNASAPKEMKLTMSAIEDIRRDVLKSGIARAEGLRNSAISALAAPVFGETGALRMCLTLIGVTGNCDTALDGVPARELKDSANRLSEMIGGNRDSASK